LWFKASLGEIVLKTPISKLTRAKMDWKCGSSDRVPSLQVQSPEFKLQSHTHTKRRWKLNLRDLIIIIIIIIAVLGFELRAYTFFVMGFFEIGSHELYTWGWL
jgi:hypothetical protein